MPGVGGEFWILRDFRELSIGGPCGPRFSHSQAWLETYVIFR